METIAQSQESQQQVRLPMCTVEVWEDGYPSHELTGHVIGFSARVQGLVETSRIETVTIRIWAAGDIHLVFDLCTGQALEWTEPNRYAAFSLRLSGETIKKLRHLITGTELVA